MSGNRRKNGRNRATRNHPPEIDLWRAMPELPELRPIPADGDPAALVKSLGTPPLPGQGAVAGHYIAAVVERAAALAAALAAAADLIEHDPPG